MTLFCNWTSGSGSAAVAGLNGLCKHGRKQYGEHVCVLFWGEGGGGVSSSGDCFSILALIAFLFGKVVPFFQMYMAL